MTLLTVQRILGMFLALFSATLLPPAAISLWFRDGHWNVFVESFAIVLAIGFVLWWPVRHNRRELRVRDGFLVVALFWMALGLSGAVPFLLARDPSLGLTDAVFESTSALTTTAATILGQLDTLPPSILYYRHQLQWFGGLGIVVLAVAVLPMLGVGGMQLYQAELPGPVKDTKLTPRITQTAKALWYIYFGITVTCAVGYWAAGMTVFDAVCHSFSTVSSGGMSTHAASLGHFDSLMIEAIAILFMIIGSVNFSLHFVAWRERGLRVYGGDPEFKGYLWLTAILSAMLAVALFSAQAYAEMPEAMRKAVFHAVSFISTTGFSTDTFAMWPVGLPVLLIFSSFIGGCGGSTAGGIKAVRWLLMYKQGSREIQRLVHPNAEIPVKLGGKVIDARIVDSVWGFFAVYVVVFVVLILIMLATGLDQVSAFSAVAAALNNLGVGLGEVASSFGTLAPVAKWATICAMVLGRLEIFALLVLVTPAFWRG
jgi:trk system potassium uptake protein